MGETEERKREEEREEEKGRQEGRKMTVQVRALPFRKQTGKETESVSLPSLQTLPNPRKEAQSRDPWLVFISLSALGTTLGPPGAGVLASTFKHSTQQPPFPAPHLCPEYLSLNICVPMSSWSFKAHFSDPLPRNPP